MSQSPPPHPHRKTKMVVLRRRETDIDFEARETQMPKRLVTNLAVLYRSTGIGIFGVFMRFVGMPLEKIALFMNSSQVTAGPGAFRQAVALTFEKGLLAPYRVVTPASLTAWFLQYSIMGGAFQFFDHSLSQLLGVRPVYYGHELMRPAKIHEEETSTEYRVKFLGKALLAPILSASFESFVSNRAEVVRYFGPEKFQRLGISKHLSSSRVLGPAFLPNATRNMIMCQTSFVLTPITYKLYFPQEKKSQTSMFWYGLSMNIFVGNVVAITQQALWGRSLDYLKQHGKIEYRAIIKSALQTEGMSAFITMPKWFSRVLMNAPAQGSLPWFYNDVLPLGERPFLDFVKENVYEPMRKRQAENSTGVNEIYKTAAEPLAVATDAASEAASSSSARPLA